jgi:hypothetical protein
MVPALPAAGRLMARSAFATDDDYIEYLGSGVVQDADWVPPEWRGPLIDHLTLGVTGVRSSGAATNSLPATPRQRQQFPGGGAGDVPTARLSLSQIGFDSLPSTPAVISPSVVEAAQEASAAEYRAYCRQRILEQLLQGSAGRGATQQQQQQQEQQELQQQQKQQQQHRAGDIDDNVDGGQTAIIDQLPEARREYERCNKVLEERMMEAVQARAACAAAGARLLEVLGAVIATRQKEKPDEGGSAAAAAAATPGRAGTGPQKTNWAPGTARFRNGR